MEAKRLEDNNLKERNMNFTIKSVSAEKRLLKIEYASNLDYAPKVAEINVDGEVLVEEADEKTAKEVADAFKKTHRLPDAMMEAVLNTINYATTATGTLLAFGLDLPAPITLPRISVGKQDAAKPQAS